jgi:hypothetical protein
MPHVTIKIDIQRLGLMSFSTMFDGTSKMAYGKKNLAASIVRSFEPVWGVPLLTQSRPCYTAGPSTPAQHSFPPLVHWRCCCLFGCQQAVYTSVQPQLGPTIEEREQIRSVSFGSNTGSCCGLSTSNLDLELFFQRLTMVSSPL